MAHAKTGPMANEDNRLKTRENAVLEDLRTWEGRGGEGKKCERHPRHTQKITNVTKQMKMPKSVPAGAVDLPTCGAR